MYIRKTVVLLIVFLACLINHTTAQYEKITTFNGRVLDAKGQPLTGVKVTLYMIVDGNIKFTYDAKMLKYIITGSEGLFSFTISDDLPGRIGVITAEKENLALGWAQWIKSEGDQKLDIVLGEPKQLSGVIVDKNSNPVSDADVFIAYGMIKRKNQKQLNLLSPVSRLLLRTKTDFEGKFTFNGLPEQATFELGVEKSGFATKVTYFWSQKPPKVLTYSPGQTDIELTLFPEAKIEGVVVEKDNGRPQEGITIAIESNQLMPHFQPAPVISGKDGTFTIDSMMPYTYKLSFVESPKELAEYLAEPVKVTLETGQTRQNVKIELVKSGLLEVLFKDSQSKKPLKGVIIYGESIGYGNLFDGNSNTDGIIQVRLLPGEYRFESIKKTGYVSILSRQPFMIKENEKTTFEWELNVQPDISGIVRDENNKSLEGVKIDVCPTGREEITTDSQGRYQIIWDTSIHPAYSTGIYLVARYEKENLAALEELQEDMKTLDVKLISADTITGKVIDIDGNGIDKAKIQVSLINPDSEFRWENTIASNIQTNKEGNFKVIAVPHGYTYKIYARADGYGQDSIKINTNETKNALYDLGTLKLSPANLSVSGAVVDIYDNPVPGVSISISGDNQPILLEPQTTDVNGKFVIKNVCAGSIRIGANLNSKSEWLSGNIDTKGGAKDVKIVIYSNSSNGNEVQPQPSSLIGKSLPDMKNLIVDYDTKQYENKRILACFWDIEQRPSRNFIIELNKKAKEINEQDIFVIAIQASKIKDESLDEWIKENNISFPVGIIEDNEEQTRFNWGVRALPWLILTDKEHIVKAEGFNLDELDNELKRN